MSIWDLGFGFRNGSGFSQLVWVPRVQNFWDFRILDVKNLGKLEIMLTLGRNCHFGFRRIWGLDWKGFLFWWDRAFEKLGLGFGLGCGGFG